MRSKIGYLEIINKSSISQRFRNFTSGSKQLDDYLKSTQKLNLENLINLPLFFIPYNEFDDIKLLKKGGEGIIYKSVWKIGLNGLEPEIVALKTLLNKSDMKKFINELDLQTKLFSTYIPLVYDYTKRPKAKEIYTTLVKWLLFDKIYITWENDLKNGITENFIYITNDFDDDFLSIDNINNSNKVTGSTLSIHDRILTGKTTSSIISNNSSPENDDYVSMQIDLVIPNNLS
ncbi:unnamed protein product [Rhizophagus irregularis]|nr:unnamed protein product [Rhizophagus irregularis]